MLAEEIFYELGIEIRYVMKLSLAIEKALAHDPMNMEIPLQKVSRGVDGKDGATGCACGAVPGQGLLESFKGTSRNQLQKPPVAKHNPANRLGDREGPEAMRHRQKDVSSDLFGEQKHALLFARGALSCNPKKKPTCHPPCK